MYQNILIVCVGNICRSPTAEQLLRKKLPKLNIYSAGLYVPAPRDADFQAIKTALKHGVIIAGHVARQLTKDMCREADLILVMEPSQIDSVAEIAPSSRSKTMLFAQWNAKKSIPDPYMQSEEFFELVYQHLEEAAELWSNKLSNQTAG
ncbi:arsenate reductase/protein-tyrosine-phosphatase family protein [Neisseria weaveri]|uniref:arsenate reductase/protein-tyrosine-phosphatase family protein n=1 Tax=Neisseria weaveri TaxID=28091 RepID=UPI0002231748|nr:protein-tyrosine-phosphatase [Neisseria weaveri]EGV35038.1 low molecular weight protein-tyrosine-phosphatase ptp [Neisseria weaveri ATCC 51223]